MFFFYNQQWLLNKINFHKNYLTLHLWKFLSLLLYTLQCSYIESVSHQSISHQECYHTSIQKSLLIEIPCKAIFHICIKTLDNCTQSLCAHFLCVYFLHAFSATAQYFGQKIGNCKSKVKYIAITFEIKYFPQSNTEKKQRTNT